MSASQPSPQQSSSPAQLLEQACTSLDYGSQILFDAAAGLCSASLLVARSPPATVVKRSKRTAKRRSGTSPFSAAIELQIVPKIEKKKRNQRLGPTVSPFFAPQVSATPALEDKDTHSVLKKRRSSSQKTSPYFAERLSRSSVPLGLSFSLQPSEFGLIQERISGDLFALVVQAMLWNKTRGEVACPILWKMLRVYPTPLALANARVENVKEMIRTLGLQQTRANRLVLMAKMWLASPPSPERRFGRRDYPRKGNNRDVKHGEMLTPSDTREGWEIAHLPGVGEYALDSYRIFGRDRLRGLHDSSEAEPEWKRLVPRDKELGPYLRWKWGQEGWEYNIESGARTRKA